MPSPNQIIKRNVISELFKTTQRKTYTTLSITIILVVLLSVLAIRPTIIKVGEIQNDVKQKQITKKSLEDKLKILTELDQKYRDFEETIPYLDKAIPEKVDTAGLTANLSEMATKNGMFIKSIQFNIENTASIFSELPSDIPLEFTKITIQLDGTKEKLTSFVKEIENYPRPMHINRISFSKISTTSSTSSSRSSSRSTSTSSVKNDTSISIEIYTIQKQGASANLENKN